MTARIRSALAVMLFVAGCSSASTGGAVLPESGKAATCAGSTCAGSDLCWKHASDTSVTPYCAPPPDGCEKGNDRMPENCRAGCKKGHVRDSEAVNWYLGEVTCSGTGN